MGGAVTLGINRTVMRTVYEKDIIDYGMDKYYELDLDADMMRKDLKELGIKVGEEEIEVYQAQ